MLPKTQSGEREFRRRKRHLEVGLIIEEISEILDARSIDRQSLHVLEFGSGDGFQIPYLERLGEVVGSDVYTSDGMRELPGVRFVEASIAQAPFSSGRFDVVFSNHVIEHIEQLSEAMSEIRRVGTPDCIYAFSVPTNIWLLLSIPSQYYNKMRGVWRAVSTESQEDAGRWKRERNGASPPSGSRKTKFARALLPRGHGVRKNFLGCYRDFRIPRWKRFFADHGFDVISTKPLLLYGPSEWPIIPVLGPKGRLCSSVLFLMTKRPADHPERSNFPDISRGS